MKKLKYFPIVFLILISVIPLLDLFHIGLPITHDGRDHVARIANFYQNLSEGNIIPRWAPNLNWGYGHPILMFLYPLPSYLASIFHFLGFSLVDSVKVVFGGAFILSGIFMYLWLKEFLNEEASFLGSILYLFAPYRFVDLYVRGALGEHVAFVFMPLTLYFMLKLSKKYSFKYFAGTAFSLFFLLLSHNAISLIFLPLIFLYAFYLSYFKKLVSAVALGFSLSSFFWIPSFFEGKYTLRDIVTKNDYLTRFVNFKDLIYGQWSYGGTGQFSVQVGAVHWIAVFLSLILVFLIFKKRNKIFILNLGVLAIFVISLFLMLPLSKPVWEKVTILQKFQFPWRFLSLTVFTSAVLGAIVFSQVKNYRKLLTVIFIVLVLLLNKEYWRANGYLLKNEEFFTGIYNSTTDTGESSPIWSVRFMEKKPADQIEVIDGDARLKKLKRTSTKHEYFIDVEKRSRIRENTLYFPGWEVLIDGKKTDVEFQDQKNRGVMTFSVEKGQHNVMVLFKETKLRLVADLISLVSVFYLLLIWKNRPFRLF